MSNRSPRPSAALVVLSGGCLLTNPAFDHDAASAGEGASDSHGWGTSAGASTGAAATSGGTGGSAGESASSGDASSGDASDGSTGVAPPTCADLVCGAGASCHETDDGPVCACDPGFDTLDDACVDIDECLEAPCAVGLCVNTPGDHSCAYPATCAELGELKADVADGPATLYVDGDPQKPWAAYCHDMAGDPREYLPLPRQTGDANIGRYAIVNPIPGFMGSRVTRFKRVRINPANLRVDIGDVTFASGEGAATFKGANVSRVAYGVAMTCVGGSTTATIDLRDTHFNVQPGLFCTDGYLPNGGTQSNGRVHVNTGGGDCGWRAPSADECPYHPIDGGAASAGERLQLVYVGL